MTGPAASLISVVQALASLGEGVGGPPRSVSQLSKALVDKDVAVSLISAAWAEDPPLCVDPRIRKIVLNGGYNALGRPSMPSFAEALEQEAQSGGPWDVVHSHGIWLSNCRQVAAWSRRRNIPLIVAPRGMLEPWAMNYKRWKKEIAWRLFQHRDLRKARAFHATAASEAEAIRNLGFKQPVAVIPNGVELPPATREFDGARDRRTALFLSRINPKKGIPMLLDAWKAVAPKDWNLVIAGNDDSRHLPLIEARIRALGLEGAVDIAGPLFGEAKEEAFRNADLFVLPSYSENFGIVVAEALGRGLPVLTTRGCPWEELETANCGWWVDPTPSGIREGLRGVFEASDEERHRMGLNGRSLIERKYVWDGIGAQMKEFYEWLVRGGRKPEFIV